MPTRSTEPDYQRWLAVVVVLACVSAGVCRAGEPAAWRPSPTIGQDLQQTTIKPLDGYDKGHPRLLFSAGDREALKKKAADHPKLWNEVLASAGRLGSEAPSVELIRSGSKYWRIERVQSGALATFVTGDKAHMERAVRWMVAHCRQDVWGDGQWRPNVDLQAAWYLYHIAIAYDVLHDELSEDQRAVIRDGLASHARAVYEHFDLENGRIPFAQNHTYIPMIGMVAASLALLDDVPEAAQWLKLGYAVMRRCRYALGTDGYYYEGVGYWQYALHWHVRYAELIARATGEKAFGLPILRQNWRFPLYLTLPGSPNAFDIGDTGRWTGTDRTDVALTNCGMFWAVASAVKSPQAQRVGDSLTARWPETVYPASAFLWYDPGVKPAPSEAIKPYHHFPDHDVVSWRSGWDKDATALLFRCGPPQGHAAAGKRKEMTDWRPDSGHVHPDIGAFWLYAKGTPLAFGTGYTGNKWTRDHNTLLVDDTGQGKDGSYWNDKGFSWDRMNKVRIDRIHLAEDYAFVSGELSGAYPATLDPLELRRTLVVTGRWLLVVDDMVAGKPRRLTWICHADGEFEADGAGTTAQVRGAALHVLPLSRAATKATLQKTTVLAMSAVPGRGTPTHRGFELTYTTTEPARRVRLVNLLVPLGTGDKAPTTRAVDIGPDARQIRLTLRWPDGKQEKVTIDLSREPMSKAGPVLIEME